MASTKRKLFDWGDEQFNLFVPSPNKYFIIDDAATLPPYFFSLLTSGIICSGEQTKPNEWAKFSGGEQIIKIGYPQIFPTTEEKTGAGAISRTYIKLD